MGLTSSHVQQEPPHPDSLLCLEDHLEWVVGIATGLITSLILFSAKFVYDWRRHRSGPLAGNWHQVTYDPVDSQRLWSVE